MKINYKEENLDFFNKNIENFKLLIITATPLEKEILHQTLRPIVGEKSLIKIAKGKQTYYFGVFGVFNAIHVACGDMGSVGRESSSITTSIALTDCIPKIVLMVGIAFGIDKKNQKIGDVIVSERVIPYEPQRVGKAATNFRGKEGPASSVLLNRFRNSDDWNYQLKTEKAKIIIGEMLSGEKLIDNPDLKKILLNQYPHVKGGEMEGAGVYAACDGHNIEWILVKGICDYADGNKKNNKDSNQKIAAYAATKLCEHIFSFKHSFESINVYPFDTFKNDDIEYLNRQVNRQLRKQIYSGKYLQDTFIETGEQKDNLRYLCDSIFYSRKCFEEINTMDFRLLNKYLKKEHQQEFDLDFAKFKDEVGVMGVSDSKKIMSEWLNHLTRKKQEIIDIKLSSNEKSKFEYKFRDRIEDLTFLKSRVALITETAGQGKTNFLCDFTENFLLKRQIPTVFLTGNEINAKDIRHSILQKVYPDSTSHSFEDFLNKIKSICYREKKFFILIIDGINENVNSKLLSKNIESLVEELLEHDFIKIVMSCRTEYYLQNFKNLEKSSFTKEIAKITSLLSWHPNDDIKKKLFDIYFQYFKIEYRNITEKALNQLVDSFLLLRIFCEVYQNQALDFIDDIYKEYLFEKYYLLKSKEINDRLLENDEFNIQGHFDIKKFISNVIEFMIDAKTYVNIPLDKVIKEPKDKDMYVRFLDESILIKRDIDIDEKGIFTNSEVVNFTFDEFRDFLISRYLIEELFHKSQKKFSEFIESEITEKSPLLEGCSTFLFFVSRRIQNETLNTIISGQPWFKRVFSRCIFSLKDAQINNKDKEMLSDNFIADAGFNELIISNLIRRFDTNYYQNLNIDFLFDLLRGLDRVTYTKCFVSKFANDNWGHSKIPENDLVSQIAEVLEKKDKIGISFNKLFELLIYMFTNQGLWEIQSLYEKYFFQHNEIGKTQLRNALTSKNEMLIVQLNLFMSKYEINL